MIQRMTKMTKMMMMMMLMADTRRVRAIMECCARMHDRLRVDKLRGRHRTPELSVTENTNFEMANSSVWINRADTDRGVQMILPQFHV